jgi:hypothetical protein
MLIPVELGTVPHATATTILTLTISMITAVGEDLHGLRERGVAIGRPIYRPVVITSRVGYYHLDLGVRAENVEVTALPLDPDRLADVEPVRSMLADYRHRLTDTAIRLCTYGFTTGGRVTAAFTVDDLQHLCRYLDHAEHHWRDAVTRTATTAPEVSAAGSLWFTPSPTTESSGDSSPVAARQAGTELSRIQQFDRLLTLSRQAPPDTPR